MPAINDMPTISAQRRSLGLALAIDCDGWSLALDADPVERIVLLDETALAVAPDDAGAFLGVVSLSGRAYAGFDLAQLLGRTPAPVAYVLLAVRYRNRRLPLALRTGHVRRVERAAELALRPLPAGLTPSRPGLFTHGFATRGAGNSGIGFKLSLDKLLTPAELACGARALASPVIGVP